MALVFIDIWSEMCADKPQLRQFNMASDVRSPLEIWSHMLSCGHRNCPSLLRDNAVVLHDNSQMHTVQKTQVLLQNFCSADTMVFSVNYEFGIQVFSSVSCIERVLVRRRKTSNLQPPRGWHNRDICCYVSRMKKLNTCYAKCLNHQRDYIEKQLASNTFIVYCQLPLLKLCH
jgi:hypothetical protein